VWAERIDRGLVRITTLATRTAADWRAEFGVPPLAAKPVQYLTPAIEDRAVEVQILLADRGQHRSESPGGAWPDSLAASRNDHHSR